MKIKLFFIKRTNENIYIHESITNRKSFNFKYLSLTILFFLFLVAGVVCFYFYGLKFNENHPVYYTNGTKTIFLILGLILFIIGIILLILISGIYYPIVYKSSKKMYLESEKYRKISQKYSKENLTKYSKKELKWFKKLNWISKQNYLNTILQLKNKNNGKTK